MIKFVFTGRDLSKNQLLKTALIMKFMLILMIVATFNATAVVYSQFAKISINVKSSTLDEVFKEIEKQSDFNIFYNVGQIDLTKVVTINGEDLMVSDLLDQVLAQVGSTYTVLDKTIVIKSAGRSGGLQSTTISGTVKSGDLEPMVGVNVVEKGTSNGTITDIDGNYTLTLKDANAILVFSYVGFLTSEQAVGSQATIDVSLAEDIAKLEEVVVIGYGTIKKSLVTGAISSVKSEDIQNTSISRAEQVLQGKTSGVQVIPVSGSPGSGMNIRIRGYSSNANSNPIFIVDGVKTQDIGSLDPNDIASMEILKDAASSAIYGAEGGNGVVMITTKQGKAGITQVNYEVQHAWQSASNLPKLMNVDQYAQFMSEGTTPLINAAVDKTYNTDWLDEIMETGKMTKHHLSFSGGNEKSSYLLSLSYLSNDGIVKGSQDKYDRYTFRLNSDHKMKSWLKVGNNFSYANSKRAAIDEAHGEFGSVIGSALQIDPATPVEYKAGMVIPSTTQSIIDKNPSVLKSPDGNYYGISQYNFGEIVNPFVTMAITNGGINQDNLNGNVYAELSPINDFTFTTRAGIDLSYMNNHSWRPTYYYTAERNNGSTVVIDQNTMNNTWSWENFATYKKSIEDHNIMLLAGMSAEDFTQRITNAQGGPMVKEQAAFSQLDYLAGQTNDLVNGRLNEFKKLSYFGRASYDYKGKYLLQGSIRRDGASNAYVPKSGRWGVFPSFSGGWVLSNEDFFSKSFLSYAKLRGSWGQNGSLSNLVNTPYGYLQAITAASGGLVIQYPLSTGNVAAFEPAYAPNPDLRWETSQQTDIGLDLRAMEDRLSFSVDYYVKTTKDLITTGNPPLEVGNNPPQINAGTVENKGLEIDLGYRNMIGDLKYAVNMNMSTLKNNVTYLDPSVGMINGAQVGPTGSWYATVFEQGHSIWHFNGYKTAGIDPATGDPIFVKKDGTKTNAAGVTAADLQDIGSPIPKLLYGANINLAYKSVDFSLNASGMSGNKVMMAWIRNDRAQVNRPTYFYDGRWTAPGQNASKPRATADSKTYNSDQIVFDGSFLRIQQIQVGYTLPSSLSKSLKISAMRFYVSLDNYFTFTKYPGMDPQASPQYTSPTTTLNNSVGIDRGTYPMPKDIMMGASITF